ncbi:helix-turn-helix domain-containing protein [Bifidobacterium samirii]|uniref:XRE family transcriptional regulator n=1 Tax=Bifidobacterium samirii TaxID=2306974 RepID=A0A430FWB3_9BIFI|nr:helix-turn-helix domain-containing protein [Bifidobacterium samirii]RSX58462.1 XRE family transcriptional regulator [Bifidobacterium samirii]
MTHLSFDDYMAKRGLTEDDLAPYEAELTERIRVYELKEARKACELTQRQLAERMGVSQKRVCELERGDLDRTQVATLKRYVEGLGGILHITAALPDRAPVVLV